MAMKLTRHGDVTRQPSAWWATASRKDAPVTCSAELDALGDHAANCNGLRGPLFRAHCALDTAEAFLTGRVVSVFFVALVGLGALYALVA